MKNISTNNYKNNLGQSYVEDEINKKEKKETLHSLWNPENSKMAYEFVKKLISSNLKYSKIIPSNEVIYKIIDEAFLNNRRIEDQLNIFSQQLAPKIAKIRVDVGFIIWSYANNAYKPINNINFDNQMVA